ncbi:hypothetical protein [[Kitasatospora] papulosa]|uniref:hypothetical protein n=1 Tax=[Kitasatospora] papulosa TaxID=1464011 RepID=UPI00367B6839
MPADHPDAYGSARDALADIWRITALRQQLIDAAARAFLFEYLRQPQAAQLFGALDDLDDMRYIGPVEYRRTVEVLSTLQGAASTLELLDGDAGEWLRQPVRQVRELVDKTLPLMKATAGRAPGALGAHFCDRYEGDFALDALRQAQRRVTRTRGAAADVLRPVPPDEGLPGPGAGASSRSCRSSARQVDALVQRASLARAAAAGSVADRLQHLVDLGMEVSSRFTATACILEDARDSGGVSRLLADVATVQVDETTDALTVTMPSGETSTVRREPDGQWTLAGEPRPYASPEGAVAALLRASRS